MQLHLKLSPAPESARIARAAAREALLGWGLADYADDALLVVSELVTNALLHGAEPLVLHMLVHDQQLLIGVQDGRADKSPEIQDAPDTRPSGRGLRLISHLCSQWGWETSDDQKLVWADLPLDDQATAGAASV